MAKDIAVGFGDDIIKVIFAVLFSLIVIVNSLLSVFASPPSLATHNFVDDINSEANDRHITKVCEVISNKIQDINNDVAEDIIENIEDGYISDFSDKVQNFWNSTDPITFADGSFCIGKKSATNDVSAWELSIKDVTTTSEDGTISITVTEEKAKMVNFFDIQSSELEFDPLYFICAYSVWHQVNDLGSDEEYTESDDPVERWQEYETKGIKKYIENHAADFVTPIYTYTTEMLYIDVTTTDTEGNTATVTKAVPAQVINIEIDVATEDDILEWFALTEAEKQQVADYYLISKTLFESSYENYENVVCTSEPAVEITNDILQIVSNPTSTASIYSAIDSMSGINAAYTGESTNQGTGISNSSDSVSETNKNSSKKGVATGYLSKPTKTGTYSSNTSVFPYYASGSYHAGYDIPVASGTKVYAADGGEVVRVQHLTTSYGYHIVIRCQVEGETYYMYYCHLSSTGNTKIGQKVKKGQYLGKSGSTGNSTGPHLHFEIRKNDNYHAVLNPYVYIKNGTSYVGGRTYG